MSRSLVLAALVLGACAPDSLAPDVDPQLTSLSSLDPWVRVKCKSATCAEAVLTTDAVSDGTITWFHPDGTTDTGTSVTVTTPDPASPFVMEVEVAYDDGKTGKTAVAIAGTRKRYTGEEEPSSVAKLIVAEVTGGDCGKVAISTIGGCFSSTDPFTFTLWEGLADPNVTEPYAAITGLDAATFTPSIPDALSRGGATVAQVTDSSGVLHVDPSTASIPALNEAPPYMTIEIDQVTLPAITVLPSGSQGTSSWTYTDALTFQCTGNDPFADLSTIPGN